MGKNKTLENESYESAQYSELYCASCLAMFEEECCCDDEDDGELLGYVCSGCGNIQNTNNGFGCDRCTGHSLEPWYG